MYIYSFPTEHAKALLFEDGTKKKLKPLPVLSLAAAHVSTPLVPSRTPGVVPEDQRHQQQQQQQQQQLPPSNEKFSTGILRPPSRPPSRPSSPPLLSPQRMYATFRFLLFAFLTPLPPNLFFTQWAKKKNCCIPYRGFSTPRSQEKFYNPYVGRTADVRSFSHASRSVSQPIRRHVPVKRIKQAHDDEWVQLKLLDEMTIF